MDQPNTKRGMGRRVAPSIGLLLVALGCPSCTTGRDFRNAALPSVRTGVNAIVDGLLDGLFAVIEPEPQNN